MNKSSNKIGYWQLKDKHVIVFVYPHSNSKSVCIGSCLRRFLTVGSMGGEGEGGIFCVTISLSDQYVYRKQLR